MCHSAPRRAACTAAPQESELGSGLLFADCLPFLFKWRADMAQGQPVGTFVDLGCGLRAAVTHHAVLAVGIHGGLAERTHALMDSAASVDEPVGGGALASRPGDALGGDPVGFPVEDGDLLIQVVRLLAL